MSAITVSKTKFKPKTFEYLRKVEKNQDTILLTDHGRPVAEIVPYGYPAMESLKSMRGLVREYIDPTSPLDESWDADS
ncbi:MAG: type II toxin-antitoxin system Phd/YefM family antitoxin [Kiritimatiellae bacterium]|nr:type II toxin-antitoxin system Phd/YefM family antitoxin [Kiritimatiellia bacterium]